MGLDVYVVRGAHPTNEDEDEDRENYVEIDSARYPEHMFKIGYWRSSYNEGGINSVLRAHGLDDLYALCDPQDRYAFVPDWQTLIARADSLLADFDDARERMRYSAFHVSHLHEGARDARAAIDAALEQIRKPGAIAADGGWSNGYGFYCPAGRKVYALVTGRNGIGIPSTWVICEREDVAWYRHALEIVKETAEWVLAQPDPKAFHLHWSS